jgi:hypothetical protein
LLAALLEKKKKKKSFGPLMGYYMDYLNLEASSHYLSGLPIGLAWVRFYKSQPFILNKETRHCHIINPLLET